MNRQIGIVVAEAYPLLRAGIERTISQQQGMKWLAEATSVSQTISLCQTLKPDILLLAPNLADYDAVESVLSIKSQFPTTHVLLLSSCAQPRSARAALNAGASGYVLKNEAINTIMQAIHMIAQGAQWISPSLLLSQQEVKKKSRLRLSKREKNVLQLMLTGKTDRQMGQVLNIHERTVRYYLRQLYNKLGVDTRIEAVVQAFHLGLV